jgi:O-antigen/teichoic acid export membrane protein
MNNGEVVEFHMRKYRKKSGKRKVFVILEKLIILSHTMPTKKIYTNTLAQIAGKVATAIISIGMIKIITGYLDIAGYGLYSKIYNYLSIFAVIADLGLYTITVRELTKHADDEKMVAKISSNVLTLRTTS